MTTSEPYSNNSILSSPSDKRRYKSLNLNNGLKCVLIKDPEMSHKEDDVTGIECFSSSLCTQDEQHYSREESDSESCDDSSTFGEGPMRKGCSNGFRMKKAAVALCVGVGHYSDPDDLPGLSHYLEHMLFMGSEKFPDENEYDSYLSKHGGSSNAFTEEETTTFHFDCVSSGLKGALERFSQFFVSPLLKSEALDREVLAVDNEFAGVVQNDGCILSQARSTCAKGDHPAGKFGWGNKKSLKDIPGEKGIDVRNRLLEYYKTHYSAKKMTLTVLSGEDMTTIEEWVRELFEDIPSGGQKRQRFDHHGFPFDEHASFSLIPSVKNEHKLSVLFQLPSWLEKEYLKKAEDYISHLVGHEGTGSLLAALKKKKIATELCAGLIEHTSCAWLFEVAITLTDSWVKGVQDFGLSAAKLLFEYLDILRHMEPQRWIWEEMKKISEMKWQFLDEEDSAEYVAQIAGDMQIYPDEHILSWSFLHDEFDAELIANVLGYMTVDRAKIDFQTFTVKSDEMREVISMLRSRGINATLKADKEWFNFSFLHAKFDPKVLDSQSVDHALLHLPRPNPFLPSNFELDYDQGNLLGAEHNMPERLKFDEQGLVCYYKRDDKFKVPKASCCFRVLSDIAYASPANAGMTHLIMNLIEDSLCEQAYLADMAGVHYNIWLNGSEGLDFRIEGFSDKIAELVTMVFKTFSKLEFNDETFDRIKQSVIQHYRNILMQPMKHAQILRIQAVKVKYWDPRDISTELEAIQAKDVRNFVKSLLSDICMLGLITGNMSLVRAKDIFSAVHRLINAKPYASCTSDCVICLPKDQSIVLWEKTFNPKEENSCIEYYLQLDSGLESKNRVLLDLIDQMIYEPCYDTLRTKEQLGYAVSSGTRLTHGIQGLCITVQSKSHPASKLEERIENFLQNFLHVLESMSDAEFEMNKQSVIDQKQLKDKNLADETERIWDELVNKGGEFDCRHADIENIKCVTKSKVIRYYKDRLHPSGANRLKLSTHVDPESRWLSASPANLVSRADLPTFHNSCAHYAPLFF